MALAGNIGALIDLPVTGADIALTLFAEDQGLYVVTARDEGLLALLIHAETQGITVERIGRTVGKRLIFELGDSDHTVTLDALRSAHEAFFPALMDAAGVMEAAS